MKSLILGATGQVGRQLLDVLGPAMCLPAGRTTVEGWLTIDLSQLTGEAELVRKLGDDQLAAIYCAGAMTNVDGCEEAPELALRTNCTGPGILAQFAAAAEIPFVYFSTEYVFDGQAGPYEETAPTNPISAYGRSKMAGERVVLDAHPRALVIRTTVVYGVDHQQKNFLYALVRNLRAGNRMRVPVDQISTPTYNMDFAKATVGLVEAGAAGIYHVCGGEVISRFDFAQQAATLLSLDGGLIEGVLTSSLGQKAPRPLSAGLLTGKLRREYPHCAVRSIEAGIGDWVERERLPRCGAGLEIR